MGGVLVTDFYIYDLHLLSHSPKSKQSYYDDFKDTSIHFQEIKSKEKCQEGGKDSERERRESQR